MPTNAMTAAATVIAVMYPIRLIADPIVESLHQDRVFDGIELAWSCVRGSSITDQSRLHPSPVRDTLATHSH